MESLTSTIEKVISGSRGGGFIGLPLAWGARATGSTGDRAPSARSLVTEGREPRAEFAGGGRASGQSSGAEFNRYRSGLITWRRECRDYASWPPTLRRAGGDLWENVGAAPAHRSVVDGESNFARMAKLADARDLKFHRHAYSSRYVLV